MRAVFILALTTGVSALKTEIQTRSYSDLVKLTMKSRHVSDVTMNMEEQPVDETAKLTLDKAHSWQHMHTIEEYEAEEQRRKEAMENIVNESAKTPDPVETFLGSNSGCFTVFVILTAFAMFTIYVSVRFMWFKVSVPQDEEESYEHGAHIYNKVAPAIMCVISFMMFCSVVGGIVRLNLKVDDQNPKTNLPGFEGKSVLHESIENPGERAFFAGFGLVSQSIFGFLICLYLRKSQEVQIATSMILKMAVRGFAAGCLATFIVEFIRLPFHDFMRNETGIIWRVLAVLFWVAFVVVLEEVGKLAVVALGLKRNEDGESLIPCHSLAHFIAESPKALAICGFAVGVGYAFVENIPRYYALAMDPPLVTISAPDYFMQTEPKEVYLVSETDLRHTRYWVFFVWGLLNINPWLTGIACMKLAEFKPPISLEPKELASTMNEIFRFVVLVHFFMDFFDRSPNASVEIFGTLAIPFAMYHFRKQWKSLSGEAGDLLTDHE